MEHGYAGMDNRSKVRHLLNGIKDPTLNTVKTTIMASATLRNDFDACVNLFQDFIAQNKAHAGATRSVHIAAVESGRGGDTELNEKNADMTVEDRYYKKPEYDKLTTAQKMGLKLKRKQRGHQPKGKAAKKSQPSQKLDLSKRAIKALARAVNKGKVQDDTDETTDSDTMDTDDEGAKDKKKGKDSNRTNSALKRTTFNK